MVMIWVPNSQSSSITVIDAATLQTVKIIPVGDDPKPLIAVNDKVWVANSRSDSVSVIDVGTFGNG